MVNQIKKILGLPQCKPCYFYNSAKCFYCKDMDLFETQEQHEENRLKAHGLTKFYEMLEQIGQDVFMGTVRTGLRNRHFPHIPEKPKSRLRVSWVISTIIGNLFLLRRLVDGYHSWKLGEVAGADFVEFFWLLCIIFLWFNTVLSKYRRERIQWNQSEN